MYRKEILELKSNLNENDPILIENDPKSERNLHVVDMNAYISAPYVQCYEAPMLNNEVSQNVVQNQSLPSDDNEFVFHAR